MAIVSYTIGDCPGCGGKQSFGNVGIYGHYLRRGCGKCQYKTGIPLPSLRKKLLYLDQFFFSGAFRGGNEKFVKASKTIEGLSANQLLVAPYSSIHEDETHQWEGKVELLEFIKSSSRGHQFISSHDVILNQLIKAFRCFLKSEPPVYLREERDVLHGDVHEWDNYYRIDIGGYYSDIEELRSLKSQAVSGLIDGFDGWRGSTMSYADTVRLEHDTSARNYINFFAIYFERVLRGDLAAEFDSPIASTFVQTLWRSVPEDIPLDKRMSVVGEFLFSDYFRLTPYHDVTARMGLASSAPAVPANAMVRVVAKRMFLVWYRMMFPF